MRAQNDRYRRAYTKGVEGRALTTAESEDPNVVAAWEQGVEDGTPKRGKARHKKPTSTTGARTRTRARSYAKPSSRHRRAVRAKGRKLTKAAKQLTPRAAAQVSSGSQFLLLTLVITALYLVVSNASPFAGFIGGAGKALDWLIRADTSIPYGPKHGG